MFDPLVLLPWRSCHTHTPHELHQKSTVIDLEESPCCSAYAQALQNWERVEGWFSQHGLRCQRVQSDGAAVNQALKAAGSPLIWFHDPDLWLPLAEVIAHLRLAAATDPGVIKPFRQAYACTRPETYHYLQGGELPHDSTRRALGQGFGRRSFLITRELWLSLGGVSQDIEGPEGIGLDLGRRLEQARLKPQAELPSQGWILHRSVSDQERELRRRDEERLQRPLADEAVRLTQEALRNFYCSHSQPCPPKPLPARLPGQLWALTCYFNPSGYQSKSANFAIFREGLRQNNVPLCLVELAFDDQPFVFQQGAQADADLLIQLRGGSICWQKERLLNIGLKALPPECDKVAWLDADVLFEKGDWARETSQMLEEFAVVQPYRWSVRLLPGERQADCSALPIGCGDGEAFYCIADGVSRHGKRSLSDYNLHGHTGYAWAARRSILEKHGFYEFNPLGNADLNMACAMFSGCLDLKLQRFSPAGGRHLSAWAERFYADIQGSVSCIDGDVFHLWHGTKKKRLYEKRLTILAAHDFLPEIDLKIGPSGALEWCTDKSELHQWCKNYFTHRDEDAGL